MRAPSRAMKRGSVAAVAVILLAAALGAWFLLSRGSDESQIHGKLDRLAKAVRVDAPENAVVRHARVNSEFVEIFTKDVLVEIPELTSAKGGRHELVGIASQASAYYGTVDLAFSRVEITLDAGKRNARVGATVTVTGRPQTGGPERDSRECTIRFDKIDGDWKIASVVVSPRAEPPVPP